MAGFDSIVGWRAFGIAAGALALCLSSALGGWWPDEQVLVFGLIVVATACSVRAARVPATRPAVAFMAVFLALLWAMRALFLFVIAGQGMPGALTNMIGEVALVWPQYVFFGGTLHSTLPRGGPIVPVEIAGVVTVLFWTVVGSVFAYLARRVRSGAILFALALATVAGITCGLVALAPRVGWQFVLDFP